MNTVIFENRFGKLTLTPITAYVPVSSILFDTCEAAQANTIDLESAEKVALITDNCNVQVCFPMQCKFESGYVIHHNGPSTASVCKVDIQAFQSDDGISPAEQIESLRPKYPTRSFI